MLLSSIALKRHSRTHPAGHPLSVMAMLVVMLSISGGPKVAMAKDLKVLSEFLIPAYIAMNVSVICAQDDPSFLAETSGPRGSALQYAEHVKDEVISSLTYEESVVILKAAADKARSIVRQKLKKLVPDYPVARPGELTDWCRNDAENFVRDIIKRHDQNHAIFFYELEQAKH